MFREVLVPLKSDKVLEEVKFERFLKPLVKKNFKLKPWISHNLL